MKYSGTFWRIVKNRSTQEFESLPYVCTLLNSSLWTYYGIIKPGEILVATVNGFGAVAEVVYVALFLIYAPTKVKVTSPEFSPSNFVAHCAPSAMAHLLRFTGQDFRFGWPLGCGVSCSSNSGDPIGIARKYPD